MDTIKFAKVKTGAKIPTKRDSDGCKDVYACFPEDFIVILPGEIKMIPTGIASAFDDKYRIGIRERGSTGTKGLAYRGGQIDSGYRGEWFIPINNISDKPIIIAKQDYIHDNAFLQECDDITVYPYEKAICQAAVEYVPQVTTEVIPYDELKEIESERGMGKLGSSEK